MSERLPEPAEYFGERLPEQFNRALREQERAAQTAQRVLEGMRAVDATLRFEVRGEGGGCFFLNVEAGRLSCAEAPAHPPVLTLVADRPDFDRLLRDAGDSALGFLGGLSGLAGEMKLTRQRLEALAGVAGCLHFEVTGEDGFVLLTHLGEGPLPDEPTTTIRIDPEVYAELQAGRLDAQNAFMSGKIDVQGDMQLAMQIALAAMAPD